MPDKIKTNKNVTSVKDYIASIDDEQMKKDSLELIKMMKLISGHQPKILNVGTIGFDTYHYKYDSGREGDCHIIGFYPRKGKMTIYLMDGTAPYSKLLAQLGKHTTSRVCLYLKRLSDVNLEILKRILEKSYKYIKSQDGKMHKANE